jgi:hypothetical protein
MLEVTIYPDGTTSKLDLGDSPKDKTFRDLADLIVKTVDMSKYNSNKKNS